MHTSNNKESLLWSINCFKNGVTLLYFILRSKNCCKTTFLYKDKTVHFSQPSTEESSKHSKQQQQDYCDDVCLCNELSYRSITQPTWEAPQHGVSVVTSIKHLERVPVLLCHKANHLDLRERNRTKVKNTAASFLLSISGLYWKILQALGYL